MEREEIIDSVVIGDLEWSARNIETVHSRNGMMPPSAWRDPETMGALSGNFTANLLGLGSAATPLAWGRRIANRKPRMRK